MHLHQQTFASRSTTKLLSMADQSFPVISPSYCAPDFVNLQINTEKGVTYDIKSTVVFNFKDTFFTLHDRRLLCDAGGNPIVTLYKQDGRWRVFRGTSNDGSELLFSVKPSSMNKRGDIKLEVFLANNKNESVCDFRVHVSSGKSSCTVYAGESPTIVAKAENNVGFKVLVHPNVDHTFIVALLMIIEKIKDFDGGSVINLAIDIASIFVDGDGGN